MHPLQSFSGGKTKLTGVYMAVDGDALAKETAETLVNFFGGKAFFLYHLLSVRFIMQLLVSVLIM